MNVNFVPMGIFKSNFFHLTPKLAKRAAAFMNARDMEKTIAPSDRKENETPETAIYDFLCSLNDFSH